MNDTMMRAFESARFGTIRALSVDGEPQLVASDVARALGYRDASNMTRSLDEDEKGAQLVSTPGGDQRVSTIT